MPSPAHAILGPTYRTGLHEYVAGSFAWATDDLAKASRFYAKVLTYEGSDPPLQQRTFEIALASGDYKVAERIARTLARQPLPDPGVTLFMIAHDVKRSDMQGALRSLDKLPDGGFDRAIRQVVKAWAAVRDGKKAEAEIEPLLSGPAFEVLAVEQLALLAMARNDHAAAVNHFDRLRSLSALTATQRLAGAAAFAKTGEREKAVDFLLPTQRAVIDGRITAAAAALRANKSIEVPTPTAAQGLGAMMTSVAAQLVSERVQLSLTFGRLAAYLDPKLPEARLLLAGVLAQRKQYDAAFEAARALNDDALRVRRALAEAEILADQDRLDEAIAALEAVENIPPDARVQLADLYRRAEKFDQAAQQYSVAVTALEPLRAEDWSLLYLRGVAYERSKKWALAEADFRRALVLRPDESNVLNYLGYSLLEQRRNLEEAHAMIRKAVDQRPDDGFMLDSLGWSHFVAGRLDEAVNFMEQAVEREPGDPTINDHLGDVYWAVDRRIEARYRWQAALDLAPSKEQQALIRTKLDVGFDVAMAEKPAPRP